MRACVCERVSAHTPLPTRSRPRPGTQATFSVGEERFSASGKTITAPGFLAITTTQFFGVTHEESGDAAAGGGGGGGEEEGGEEAGAAAAEEVRVPSDLTKGEEVSVTVTLREGRTSPPGARVATPRAPPPLRAHPSAARVQATLRSTS